MKRKVFYLMSMALIALSFINVMKTEAQVTMGEAAPGHPASLLDLRTSKGLLLSKVRLEKATKFQLSTNKTLEAKGTIIYNTNPLMEDGYGEGLYLWDGLKWNLIEENEMPVIDCTGPPDGITINGFSGTVDLNETITVTCKVNTSGNTAYAWTVPQGLEVSGDQDKPAITLIAKVAGSYRGENLRCAVTNACGGGSSIAGSQLTVNGCTGVPTADMSTISGSYVRNVGTFDVTCTVTSKGTNSYAWTVPGGLKITGGQGTNKITVHGTTAGDYQGSTITCVVKNECDTQGQSFHPSGAVTITGEGNEGGYATYCFPDATHLPCWMTDNSKEGSSHYWYEGASGDVQHSIARGKYYTYAQATQKSGNQYVACPTGWTLPNEQDFKNLVDYLSTHPYEKAKYMHDGSYAGFGMVAPDGKVGSTGWGVNFGWWGDGALIFNSKSDKKLESVDYRKPSENPSFAISVRCIKR